MAWAQLQDRYPTRLEVPKEEWESLVNQIDEQEQMKVQGVKVREKGGLTLLVPNATNHDVSTSSFEDDAVAKVTRAQVDFICRSKTI